MIESITLFLLKNHSYVYMIMIAIAFIKLALFVVCKTTDWGILNIIYFDDPDIMQSSSRKEFIIKRTENVLTLLFVIIAFLQIFTIILKQSIQV